MYSRREILGMLAMGACAGGEAPGVHNWMLVGSKTAFLSHLPMFDQLNDDGTEYLTPHRFQVILQCSLGSGYFSDRESHPDVKMYTVSPAAKFVLQPGLKSFSGTVFRGHLERGGVPFLRNASVKIQKVLHFRKFDPAEKALETLDYLLFGSGPDAFLAHTIMKPPDFDQIISVTGAGDIEGAIRVTVPARKNTAGDRVKAGEEFEAVTADGKALSLRVGTEFYFEEGELLLPPTFDPTAEEEKAGFSD